MTKLITKTPYQNEKIKRDFYEYLRGSKGFSESSIRTVAGAISQWETFSSDEDFINFNKTKAVAFREWLQNRKTKTESGKLDLSTQHGYILRIKKFFKWLSEQPGYKSKVLKNEVEWLRLSKIDARVARQGTRRTMPTFDEIKKIIQSINGNTEIDMRDRALISFALITGARINAIVSLKMKSFNKEANLIDQNPKDGVKTKNSKQIFTTFFPVGWDEPRKYFINWYEHLESKGFQSNDPIFPSTLASFAEKTKNYSKELVGNNAWTGTSPARKIFQKRCLNAGVPYFNPHSFRHVVVSILIKLKLTEKDKKAISLNLGHENIGTTFGSSGYGHMPTEEAINTVKDLKSLENSLITDEERVLIKRLADKI